VAAGHEVPAVRSGSHPPRARRLPPPARRQPGITSPSSAAAGLPPHSAAVSQEIVPPRRRWTSLLRGSTGGFRRQRVFSWPAARANGGFESVLLDDLRSPC